MKKALISILLLVFVSGCSSNKINNASEETKTKETSINSSSESTDSWLSVNGSEPKYVNGKTLELTGTAKPNTEVIINLENDNKEIAKVKADEKGKFKLSIDSPKDEDSYLFQNEKERLFITLYSESNFKKRNDERKKKDDDDKLKSEKETEIKLSREKEHEESVKREEFKKISESTEDSLAEISSTDSSNKTEPIKITDKQKELLIVFTQQELDDRDIKYKFSGYDSWKVVTNDQSKLKKYIVTTNDKKSGRIKAIYEWDGDKNSGADLKYLLVHGEELVNNLN